MERCEAMPTMSIKCSELVMCMPDFAVKVRHSINTFEVLLSDFSKTLDRENALLGLWLRFGRRKIRREGDVLEQAFDNG